MPQCEIDRFVLEKERWIIENIAKQREWAERKKSFVLDYGSSILFRGKLYPIEGREGTYVGFDSKCGLGDERALKIAFDGKAFCIPQELSTTQIKFACIQLYKILAKSHISDRAAFFASQMGVVPTAVKINSAAKRWGSCSSRKSINFSWRLIMADDAIIDYVVVHELAHIKEMNHSARFWAVVENVLPNYQEHRRRLKELQHRLSGEDWA